MQLNKITNIIYAYHGPTAAVNRVLKNTASILKIYS